MSVSRVGIPAIGLTNDPSKKFSNVSSTFWQHADRDHIEHLYCLIESYVEFAQVEEPQQHESESRHDQIKHEHDSDDFICLEQSLIRNFIPQIKNLEYEHVNVLILGVLYLNVSFPF